MAEAAGAHAVLAVTPYYNRPSRPGCPPTSAPSPAPPPARVIDDIPCARADGSSPLTIELAREVANIVGVKDATGDAVSAAIVVAKTPR